MVSVSKALTVLGHIGRSRPPYGDLGVVTTLGSAA